MDVSNMDGLLAALEAVHRLGLGSDFVLLSAVWMHLRPPERPWAFRKMVTLLKPGGLLIMTLRNGHDAPDRPMHPVLAGEVEQLAGDHGLAVIHTSSQPDRLGQAEASWTTMCLRLPDDGSAGLPLIRGIELDPRLPAAGARQAAPSGEEQLWTA